MSVDKNQNITRREQISFGLGDFAINGMFTFSSSYLMYFYTDYAKLGLELISIILILGRMIDAVASVCFGNVMDRNIGVDGKCRPMIRRLALPLVIMFVLSFFLPAAWPAEIKSLCAILFYSIFSICYAGVNVPYSAMLSVMTEDDNQRLSFNVAKNVGSGAGAVIVSSITLTLVAVFEKKFRNPFATVALLFAVVAGLLLYICVKNTRERVTLDKGQEITDKGAAWRSMLHNRPFVIFCIVMFTEMTYMIMHNQATIYYAKYYLKSEAVGSILLANTPLACALVAFVLPNVVKRIGLKQSVMLGNLLIAASLALTKIVGGNMIAVVALSLVTSVGWAFATGMVFVIVAKTIDIAKEKDGLNLQGIMTSIITFLMKEGVAIAGFICPLIMSAGGYEADAPVTDALLRAIDINFIYVPMILAVLMAVVMKFFDE